MQEENASNGSPCSVVEQVAVGREGNTTTNQCWLNMPLDAAGSMTLKMTVIEVREVKKLVLKVSYIWPAEQSTSNCI